MNDMKSRKKRIRRRYSSSKTTCMHTASMHSGNASSNSLARIDGSRSDDDDECHECHECQERRHQCDEHPTSMYTLNCNASTLTLKDDTELPPTTSAGHDDKIGMDEGSSNSNATSIKEEEEKTKRPFSLSTRISSRNSIESYKKSWRKGKKPNRKEEDTAEQHPSKEKVSKRFSEKMMKKKKKEEASKKTKEGLKTEEKNMSSHKDQKEGEEKKNKKGTKKKKLPKEDEGRSTSNNNKKKKKDQRGWSKRLSRSHNAFVPTDTDLDPSVHSLIVSTLE